MSLTSCDTNILLHAINLNSPFHEKAADFMARHKTNESFCLCELVLVELYVLLRNPAVLARPLSAGEASQMCGQLRSNPVWGLLDYPGPQAQIMDQVWTIAAEAAFARRRIFDARLAFTLSHWGVTDFATQNIRDFQDLGLARVFDPLS